MAQQAIITTDELEIYRQADSYLVRQKLRNRFIRMGERELRCSPTCCTCPHRARRERTKR